MKLKLFLPLLLFVFISCEHLQKELPVEVSKSLVSIHRIEDYGGVESKLVLPLEIDGQTIYISRIPLISNRHMIAAKPFQYTDDYWGLEVSMTRSGANRWTQSELEYRGIRAILAEGGQFKCFIKIGRGGNGLDFKIAMPLTKEEAEKMASNISRNYQAIKELD